MCSTSLGGPVAPHISKENGYVYEQNMAGGHMKNAPATPRPPPRTGSPRISGPQGILQGIGVPFPPKLQTGIKTRFYKITLLFKLRILCATLTPVHRKQGPRAQLGGGSNAKREPKHPTRGSPGNPGTPPCGIQGGIQGGHEGHKRHAAGARWRPPAL